MRQRLLKSLRIAVTAVLLLVCGVLIVLWVRSYWRVEGIGGFYTDRGGYVQSARGGMQIVLLRNYDYYDPGWGLYSSEGAWIKLENGESLSISERFGSYARPANFTFAFRCSPGMIFIAFPHWFLILAMLAVAIAPWIKWRFSLRTLLIVFTLFALFFGAIAMSM